MRIFAEGLRPRGGAVSVSCATTVRQTSTISTSGMEVGRVLSRDGRWCPRAVGFVDLRRAASGPCRPYCAPDRRPGCLPEPCSRSLAKGTACRLPARRASSSCSLGSSSRRFHRSRSRVARSKPWISLAFSRSSSLMRLSQESYSPPGRARTVAPADLAGRAPCIGICIPKPHTTSRFFSTLPDSQRRAPARARADVVASTGDRCLN